MAQTSVGGHVHGLFATNRTDNWWVGPALTAVGLGFFVLYLTWAGWQANHYHAGPYLSPAYAPLLFVDPGAVGGAPPEAAWIAGTWPEWWPGFLPKSPNFMIVLMPIAFRSTCYYYRKAYYRAFFGTPPGCAVGGVPHNYSGETTILLFQNLHRYTLYLAIVLLPFLYMDAFHSLFWNGEFGIGLGSILIWGNAMLLTAYTLGCHAWRHLIGGRLNCFSCDGRSELQHKAWSFTTWLNERHMLFAWTSLYWFLCTEVYVRLLSHGIISDINTWQGITNMSNIGAH